MKLKKNPQAADAFPPAAGLNQNEIDFAPPSDTVAKKSNFIPVNRGSSHGHEVRHWLQAEAQLIAERKSARAPGPGAK